MKDVRIAAVTCRCPVDRFSENLETAAAHVRAAKAAGAALVCFPELSICGYSLNRETNARAAESYETVVRDLSALAMENAVGIIAGAVSRRENSGGCLAVQLFCAPDGSNGFYCKIHLAPPEEDVFAPGASLPLFAFDTVRFGVQLCYDAHFPELSTRLALRGADIIFIPHASPRGSSREKYQSWMRHLPARAFDNGVFVVACNQAGDNGEGLVFPPLAVVLGPDGRVLAKQKEAEQMLVVDLLAEDLAAVRKHRMRYFLPRRRPEIY